MNSPLISTIQPVKVITVFKLIKENTVRLHALDPRETFIGYVYNKEDAEQTQKEYNKDKKHNLIKIQICLAVTFNDGTICLLGNPIDKQIIDGNMLDKVNEIVSHETSFAF